MGFCFDIFIILVGLTFFGVLIVNIVLPSIIIHQKIKNTFKDALDYNHHQHLYLSLSTDQIFDSVPLTFGNTSYYSKKTFSHNKWKGTKVYGRELETTYLSLLEKNSVPKGNQCLEGSHQCGILDTVENILCLDNSQQCPINDIVITNTNILL